MSDTKPTRPGWWWWQWGKDEPEVLFLENLEAAYPGPQWLAPIPSPAVCEALARYAAFLVSDDDDGTCLADHTDALERAIRAERDGAA